MGLEDLIILLVLALFFAMCCANYLYSFSINHVVKKKLPDMADTILVLVALVVLFMASMAVAEFGEKLRVYKTPKPIHLVFWGYEEKDIDVLSAAQSMINLTNSRVVLFGDAAENPPDLPNIVAVLPNKTTDFNTIRMWFTAYREEIKKWKGSVAVFGVKLPVRPDGYKMFYQSASVVQLQAAIKRFELLELLEDLPSYGVFEQEFSKTELCIFETKNSPSHSGRQPLQKSLSWSRGL